MPLTRAQFKQRMQEAPLLSDGAMGTMLHGKGISFEQCFDEVNCDQPALVADIHRRYIEAGSDLIETNTFGANRYKLMEHGLEEDVVKINNAAVSLARHVIQASFKPVWLAGSVGPLGIRMAPLGRISKSQAKDAFREQIMALVNPEGIQGIDLLFIETMTDIKEVETAITAARSVAADLPIIAQMTFTRDDRTPLGDSPSDAAAKLAELDVDAIGINCSGGPVQILRLLMVMKKVAPNLPLAVSPNAGWPEHTEGGRVLYPATPDYFAQYTRAFLAAGATIIGGCCGTTEAHIAAMREAIDSKEKNNVQLPKVQLVNNQKENEPLKAVVDQPTELALALENGRFIATVEMAPPKGISPQKMLAGAQMLHDAGANFLDVADSPLARMRMSAWGAAHLIQQKIGIETILHFPTRGRNILRIQGDLLAAHAMGIRNLFVVMGDPTHIGDFPEAMDNYDIVPSGLIQMIKERFNSGVDQAGRSIDQPTNFVVGCALSLTPKNVERELKLMRKKVRNGADFALTQPVFDPVQAQAFVKAYEDKYEEPMIPIIAGIKPLYNSRNAEFLHNEVPGIIIPDEMRARMKATTDSQAEGVQIAQEILTEMLPFIQGTYLMPAFGRYDLVADVLDVLPKPEPIL